MDAAFEAVIWEMLIFRCTPAALSSDGRERVCEHARGYELRKLSEAT
jgi:hypothetical protein